MFTMRTSDNNQVDTASFNDPATLIKEMARGTVQLLERGSRGIVMKASTGVGKSTHYIVELYKLLKAKGFRIYCSQLTIQNTLGTA